MGGEGKTRGGKRGKGLREEQACRLRFWCSGLSRQLRSWYRDVRSFSQVSGSERSHAAEFTLVLYKPAIESYRSEAIKLVLNAGPGWHQSQSGGDWGESRLKK